MRVRGREGRDREEGREREKEERGRQWGRESEGVGERKLGGKRVGGR